MFNLTIANFSRLQSCRILWCSYLNNMRRATKRGKTWQANDYRQQMRDIARKYAELRGWVLNG